MVPKGRIGRPFDAYKATVIPIYYIGIWLRIEELNLSVGLMRPESSHCFNPLYQTLVKV